MGLADDALKLGLRTPSIPVNAACIEPVCPPFEGRKVSWESLCYDTYPDMIRKYVEAHMREIQAREWQWAFLLWGIHR